MNFPIHLLLDTVLMFPLIADTYDGSLLVQDENSTVLFNGTFPLTTPTIFLQNSLTDHLSIKFDPTLSIKERYLEVCLNLCIKYQEQDKLSLSCSNINVILASLKISNQFELNQIFLCEVKLHDLPLVCK